MCMAAIFTLTLLIEFINFPREVTNNEYFNAKKILRERLHSILVVLHGKFCKITNEFGT